MVCLALLPRNRSRVRAAPSELQLGNEDPACNLHLRAYPQFWELAYDGVLLTVGLGPIQSRGVGSMGSRLRGSLLAAILLRISIANHLHAGKSTSFSASTRKARKKNWYTPLTVGFRCLGRSLSLVADPYYRIRHNRAALIGNDSSCPSHP